MGASYKKTIVIGLDYSEFSGGISECKRKMGLLDAEMKLAQEQAKAYGDETDQLKIKQEGLAQKIELQRKIVEKQAEAYNKAISSQDKSQKQIDALDKTLLQNRTTLQKLENEYKNNNKQLEEFSKKSKDSEEQQRSFGDAVRDMAEYIGISANPAIETFAGKFDAVDEDVGKAVLTIGTLVTTLGAITIKTAEHAKEIENVSQTMGMTTNEYQAWDYVLKSVGYEAESASGDLAALAEKAKDAAEGGNDSAKTFSLLGISVKDSHGALKSQNQLFTEVISSLRKMEDETTRNAIASDLLSTTGEKIVPILNMTTEEFIRLRDAAYDTGYVMSEETLDGFSDLNKTMADFDGVMSGLQTSFATIMLPLLTDLFKAITAIPPPVLQTIVTITGMVLVISSTMKAVNSTVGAFDKFTDMLAGVDAKTYKTTGIIIAVVAALIALATIIGVIVGKGNDINATMDSVASSIGNVGAATQGVSRPRYHAKGTDYFEGGETWVGEDGPELLQIPRGSRITNSRQAKAMTGDTYYITVNAKVDEITSIQKLIDIAKQEQVALRAGRVKV